MDRKQLELAFLAGRELRIRRARRDFWEYCKLRAPEFYMDSRWHLRLISWVLQALYENRLTKASFKEAAERIAPQWFIDEYDWSQLHENAQFKNLALSVPP